MSGERIKHRATHWIGSALLLSAACWAAGCTGPNVARSGGDYDPDWISQQEIRDAAGALNAYALVQRLRPNWLHKRGPKSIRNPGGISVYVDGIQYGSTPRALRSIQVVNVESLEFLGAARATNRHGAGHEYGAIVVHTKGG